MPSSPFDSAASRPRGFHLYALIVHTSFASLCGGMLMLAGAWLYLSPQLPEVSALRDIELQIPMRIYSKDGLLIGEFGEKRRIPVAYGDLPQQLIDAFLTAEDDRFLSHPGIDITSLARAMLQYLSSGDFKSGGSTITMQVARNYFLSRERTIARKLNEILLALQIERELQKTEILALYINKIYLGHRAYGAAAAAQVYYGKNLKQLSLAECAMIAGLPKAPSAINPLSNPEQALVRRNWILDRMFALGYADEAAWREARVAPVTAYRHGAPIELNARYAAEMARREVIRDFGLSAYTRGLRVFTSVDSHLQRAAQQATITGLQNYDRRHGYRGATPLLARPATADTPGEPVRPDDKIVTLLDALAQHRPVAIWQPAMVLESTERRLVTLLRNGGRATLNWEQGLSKAAPYINENRTGRAPKQASDVALPGDLVWLWREELDGADTTTNNGWRLGQLPDIQGALISMDTGDGAIRAMVGGLDFRRSNFNHATQGERQPGSGFKPFIYAAALDSGLSAASIFNDAPVVFEDKFLEDFWRPSNASGRFSGPTRLRVALRHSRNLVSVRLLRHVGIGKTVDYLARFGFDTKAIPRDLSLALGSYAVTPLKLCTAYASLANGGYRVAPYLVERIDTDDKRTIFQAAPNVVPDRVTASTAGVTTGALAPRILDKRVSYILDHMMQDVIQRGTGRRARVLSRSDLAGKTGTTNGPRDAWFSGYHPQLATIVWVGFDQNRLLGAREQGAATALPIWIDYMREALAGVPIKTRETPDGVVVARIDQTTGKPVAPGQAGGIFEVFRRENTPLPATAASDRVEANSPPAEQQRDAAQTRENERLLEDLF